MTLMLYVLSIVSQRELSANNQMAGMMNSPEFMQGMADMMSRPEIVDQVRLLPSAAVLVEFEACGSQS